MNLQLGLRLKKINKLGFSKPIHKTQTKLTSKGLVMFNFLIQNLIGSVFITYKIDYIGLIHFLSKN